MKKNGNQSLSIFRRNEVSVAFPCYLCHNQKSEHTCYNRITAQQMASVKRDHEEMRYLHMNTNKYIMALDAGTTSRPLYPV